MLEAVIAFAVDRIPFTSTLIPFTTTPHDVSSNFVAAVVVTVVVSTEKVNTGHE
jgi:hypothetical protein